jgi:hypothetical protein
MTLNLCTQGYFDNFPKQIHDYDVVPYFDQYYCLNVGHQIDLWESTMYDFQRFTLSMERCQGDGCYDDEVITERLKTLYIEAVWTY